MSLKNVIYAITVPRYINEKELLTDNPYIKVITNLLDKNGIEWNTCDTVVGSFNLNQEWIETKGDIEAEIEWDKALPTKWSEEDKEILYDLAMTGKIIIHVTWKVKNELGEVKYIPNH